MSDAQQQQHILDVLNQLAADLELAAVNIRRILDPQHQRTTSTRNTAPETVFSALKWDLVTGQKMGEFEIAGSQSNPGNPFQTALKVLADAKATIQTRYHAPGYAYSYWLYGEGKIYRQRLKETHQ